MPSPSSYLSSWLFQLVTISAAYATSGSQISGTSQGEDFGITEMQLNEDLCLIRGPKSDRR